MTVLLASVSGETGMKPRPKGSSGKLCIGFGKCDRGKHKGLTNGDLRIRTAARPTVRRSKVERKEYTRWQIVVGYSSKRAGCCRTDVDAVIRKELTCCDIRIKHKKPSYGRIVIKCHVYGPCDWIGKNGDGGHISPKVVWQAVRTGHGSFANRPNWRPSIPALTT